MNDTLEDLASRYVLGRLDAAEHAAFEARLLVDATLVTFVRKLEAALDLRRSLLALHPTLHFIPS
jgi:anti-sigma-K factor RskA